MTSAADITDALQGLIDGDFDIEAALPDVEVRTRTFADAGLLTNDVGLVLTLSDGSEYQVTVVRSR